MEINKKMGKKHKKAEGKKSKMPKHFRQNCLVLFGQAARNQMMIAVSAVLPNSRKKDMQYVDSELVEKFGSLKSLNPDMYKTYLSLMREMTRNIFGVWQPKILLKSADDTNGGTPVVTNVGSTLVNVLSVQSSACASISLLWAIFDEYRAVGPFRCFFTPADTSTSRLYGVGVIDYSNNSNLASVSEAMSYDTMKIFDIVPYHFVDAGIAKWNGRVIGIPDLTWVTTGTNIVWAYWKTYSFNAADASWGISTTYGWWTFEVEVEFRQLNQGG